MKPRPFLGCHCADCCIGTFTIGEYYMVKDDVWERAWAGRRKPWHKFVGEILCIGCLEKRIGRKLEKSDFAAYPVNDLGEPNHMSARLRERLTTDRSTLNGDLFDWLASDARAAL